MEPRTTKRCLTCGFWAAVVLFIAAAAVMTFTWTPVEKTMGPVQKVFYVHFPMAISTFMAFTVCFVGCVGYLYTRRRAFDDVALAGAQVGVVLCSVVLLTGMVWARSAWGQWWTWSPRLTFSLVLWLLFVVYLMIRPSIASPTRRALVGSVYGLVAYLDVPLVYFSVKLMPDIHPSSIQLDPAMKLTAAVWFVPILAMTAGLIVSRYRLARREATTLEAPDTEPELAVSLSTGGAA